MSLSISFFPFPVFSCAVLFTTSQFPCCPLRKDTRMISRLESKSPNSLLHSASPSLIPITSQSFSKLLRLRHVIMTLVHRKTNNLDLYLNYMYLLVTGYSKQLILARVCTGWGKIFWPFLEGYNFGRRKDIEVLIVSKVASFHDVFSTQVSDRSSAAFRS